MKFRNPCQILFFFLFLSLFSFYGCDEKKSGADGKAAPVVTYMKIEPVPVTLTRELPGRTSPHIISDVRPQVSGIIQERFFTEGAHVEKGELLYQIDPSLYQATYDSAVASLKEAEAKELGARLLENRYKTLVQTHAVSKQEYDDAKVALLQARAQVALAKASLETARINLDYTKITAPVSGFIGRSSVTPGALVTGNQEAPLARVQQLDPIYVDITRSSSEVFRVEQDIESGKLVTNGEDSMTVFLKLEDGNFYSRKKIGEGQGSAGLERVPGELKFSEVMVDPSTDVVTMRALFPNPDGRLLPGLYVRALIEEGTRENGILIPQKTVARDARGVASVKVLIPKSEADGKNLYTVESRTIIIDRPMGNMWLVLDGLEKNDLLLVEGGMHVRPGQVAAGIEE